MCAYLDPVERAIVVVYTVVLAAFYSTSDVLVSKFSSHNIILSDINKRGGSFSRPP